MDGNRGAKGSIKDRLISILYRLRYKKKKEKEEEYELENKKRQKDYIQRLQDFNDSEDIDYLDEEDMEYLDSIKSIASFNLTDLGIFFDYDNITLSHEKKEYVNNSLSKVSTVNVYKSSKGIDFNDITNNIDSDLVDIEFKTHELDTKVDLKQEKKKVDNEIVIVEEVKKFIDDSIEKIDEIKNDISEIKTLTKNKNQDTKIMEEKYKKLKEKVDKLKQQYDTVKDKYDLSEFSILESIKLIDNIVDYKQVASLNEMDMMLNICKKEINQISSITIVKEETTLVKENIVGIKNEQHDIKIKFNKSKEHAHKLNNTTNFIKTELATQKKIVDEMYDKASKIDKEITKEIEYSGYTNVISSMLRIMGGIASLPISGLGIFKKSLGTTMINKGLKDLNKGLEKHEKIIVNYKYEDLTDKIRNVKDKMEYTNLLITDSLSEIYKLKENFKNEYSEFSNVLPNYEETLKGIETLESKLIEEQSKITSINEKVNKEQELNKQKLKKLERYNKAA